MTPLMEVWKEGGGGGGGGQTEAEIVHDDYYHD